MTTFEAVRNQFRSLKEDSSPFAVEALTKLQFHVDRYIDTLITESFLIMDRYGSDQIHPEFVDMAATHILSQRRRKFLALAGMIGGGCLSAAFTKMYEILPVGKLVEPRAVLVMMAWFCAGVVLIAVQLSRE